MRPESATAPLSTSTAGAPLWRKRRVMSTEWQTFDSIEANKIDMPSKSYKANAVVEPTLPKTNGFGHANAARKKLMLAAKSPGEYVGSGILDVNPIAVRGHKRVGLRSPRGNLSPNGIKEKKFCEDDPNELVEEKYQDAQGRRLTSLKWTEDYAEALMLDKKELPHSPPNGQNLASGRVPAAGWERSGIRFAPLNVPAKRRLQTLVVLMHTLSVALTVTAFFWACAVPLFWPLLLPYLIYVLLSKASTSGELSHRSEWLRRQKIWSLFASYFPARLHRTIELPPTRKYLFGYHPHGIISHGAFAAFCTEALGFSQLFPGITNTLLTLESNFRIPFYRDYLLRLGLASVSRESCENLLSKGGPNGEGMGRAITIVIGGAAESLETQPGTLRLILHRRKGFIKLAIRTGADLVPVLAFGENDIYDQLSATSHPHIHKLQMFIKRMVGFTLPLFHARGIFNYDVGIMPYRRPMNIVVGRPIKVMMNAKPDVAYVDEIHAQYVKELQRTWDTWKNEFAEGRRTELEIIE